MKNRYLRDINYKIIDIYYKGYLFRTDSNYYGLYVNDTMILPYSEFDILCSEQIARKRLLLMAKTYVDTLNS